MRYIDSGGRDPAHAVGKWLAGEAADGVAQLRLQSGYFGVDGLSPFTQALAAMALADAPVRIVIGSNAGETPAGDVEALAGLLALPRDNAGLAVISFGNALFHPKTWHMVRADGSQAAYVGSANLGRSGVSGLNVEAGVLLDEREGDPGEVISQVGAAVDAWFAGPAPGVEFVADAADVARLVASGWLAKVRPPRSTGTGGGAGAGGSPAAKLAPLVTFPSIPKPGATGGAGNAVAGPSASGAAVAAGAGATAVADFFTPAVATAAGYPPNMYFAASPLAPTAGLATLSNKPLPGAAAGLVLRLSKDTTRHWTGGTGTANISLPIAALEPLRFGFNVNGAPRAEPGFRSRFVGNGVSTRAPDAITSVMAYGYGLNPTGHKDVRMVLPKPSADALALAAAAAGSAVPGPGDYAFLEWPTPAAPSFGLTVMDTGSPLYASALALASTATQAGRLVGGSSCWLPAGVAPAW